MGGTKDMPYRAGEFPPIGPILKELRRQRGWSQVKMAKELGKLRREDGQPMSHSNISKLERAASNPEARTVAAAMNALEVTHDEFYLASCYVSGIKPPLYKEIKRLKKENAELKEELKKRGDPDMNERYMNSLAGLVNEDPANPDRVYVVISERLVKSFGEGKEKRASQAS